jgi:hypothetical protein
MSKLNKIVSELQILAAEDTATVAFQNPKDKNNPIRIEIPYSSYYRPPHLIETAQKKALQQGIKKEDLGKVLYIIKNSTNKVIYDNMSFREQGMESSWVKVYFTNTKEPKSRILIRVPYNASLVPTDYIPLALKKAKEGGVDMKTIGNVLMIKNTLDQVIFDPTKNLRF